MTVVGWPRQDVQAYSEQKEAEKVSGTVVSVAADNFVLAPDSNSIYGSFVDEQSITYGVDTSIPSWLPVPLLMGRNFHIFEKNTGLLPSMLNSFDKVLYLINYLLIILRIRGNPILEVHNGRTDQTRDTS